MKTIKILTQSDIQLFENFINTDKNVFEDDIQKLQWEYHKKLFLEQHKEHAISAIITDKIEAVIMGYSVNVRWRRENLIPFWIGSKLYSYNNQPINSTDKDRMISILVEYFENLGFNSCYLVLMMNKNNRLTDDRRINTYIRRAYKNLRYNFYCEKVVDNHRDFDHMCGLYKIMCPKVYGGEQILILKGIKVRNPT